MTSPANFEIGVDFFSNNITIYRPPSSENTDDTYVKVSIIVETYDETLHVVNLVMKRDADILGSFIKTIKCFTKNDYNTVDFAIKSSAVDALLLVLTTWESSKEPAYIATGYSTITYKVRNIGYISSLNSTVKLATSRKLTLMWLI
jgi:hypothetical protein